MLQVVRAFDRSPIAGVETDDAGAQKTKLAAAARTFRDRDGWIEPHQRIDILRRLSGLIDAKREHFSRLIAQEGGKPLTDARIEVTRAIDGVRDAAGIGFARRRPTAGRNRSGAADPTPRGRSCSDVGRRSCREGRLAAGGKRLSETTVNPTVLVEPSVDAKVSREEIFGPVTCVYGFTEIDEAIAIANALPVAFQASIFTQDLTSAMRAADRLDASSGPRGSVRFPPGVSPGQAWPHQPLFQHCLAERFHKQVP
jgi:acyl-CoA reductase-like NAD-dependent aldehyde dehydrogenase